MATAPSGPFTKKIHRHEIPEVSTPPSKRAETATAIPVIAPQMPGYPAVLAAERIGEQRQRH